MKFTRHSGIYRLYAEQQLNAPIEKVWEFFSDPENLNKLSPKEIGFEITSPVTKPAYPGQIITYKIQLFPIIKMKWCTEITQIETNSFFIDEQRFGPYKMWHHEHRFISNEKGVLMTDTVWFKMPFGILGHLAMVLFVKKKLRRIFQFRAENTIKFL